MRSAGTWLMVCTLLLMPYRVEAQPSVSDARARQNYLLHCMGCHGEHGAGLSDHVPSLRGSLAAFARTAEGRAYLMSVPGVVQTSLSPPEVAEVMNWALREFNSAQNVKSIRPFTAEEIAAARSRPLLEVVATRQRLRRVYASRSAAP